MRINLLNKVLVSCLFLLATFPFKAQEEKTASSRPVTGVYSLELGRISVNSSYLSPLTYTGTLTSLSGMWSKAMPFNPEKAVMQFETDVNFSSLLNEAQTSRMLGLTGHFLWSLSWRKHLPSEFQFTLGGGVDLEGGAYYLIRNSNNPVQAMANISLVASASLSKYFKIGKLPVLITDRVNIPSLGVFFCPQYGETYYEIYLGNHKGLAHAGWWGNNFRLNNLLSVSLDFGRTAMMIGYRFNIHTQWANNLNTKIISNSFVIGVVPHGLGLKKRQAKLPEEIIYSLY